MTPNPLVRNLARLFGVMWIVANLVNVWLVLSAVITVENPYVRAGYAGFGLVIVPVIFYCAFHIVALTSRIVLCLKILLAVSAIPVVVRGIVPLEVVG